MTPILIGKHIDIEFPCSGAASKEAIEAWNEIIGSIVVCSCSPEQYKMAVARILAAIEKGIRAWRDATATGSPQAAAQTQPRKEMWVQCNKCGEVKLATPAATPRSERGEIKPGSYRQQSYRRTA